MIKLVYLYAISWREKMLINMGNNSLEKEA